MGDLNVGTVKAVLKGDTAQFTQAMAKAEESLKQVESAMVDLAEEAPKTADKIEKIGQEAQQAGRDAEEGMRKAEDAVKDFGEEAKKTETKTEHLGDAVKHTGEQSERTGNKFETTGKKMVGVGSKLSLSVTAPLLAVGAAAIKTAADFEKTLASIQGLVGVGAAEVQRMGEAARGMAIAYGSNANAAADAMYFISSAGLAGAAANQVLEQSLKASATGLGDVSVIADTLSSVLGAYGQENITAAQATDALVASVREGKMEADALAGALPSVLPLASAMGISFEEVGAAFAAMSRNGTDANEAATQLRGIMSSLLNPAKQAEDQLAALGLSGAGLRQTIREDGLLAGLSLLTQAFGNNEEAAGTVFGNIRALTGVMSLFGAATASTEKIFSNLTDNTGDLDKAFNVVRETAGFKMQQAMAQLKDAMLSIGQVLIPVIVPVFEKLGSVLKGAADMFSKLPGPAKAVLLVFAGLAVAAGPLLVALGMIAQGWARVAAAQAAAAATATVSWTAILGPAAIAVAGVVALAAAWSAFSGRSREAEERQTRLTDALRSAGDPTANLTAKTKALVEEYKALQAEQAGATAEVEAMVGAQAFVQQELTDLIPTFAKYGVNIEELTDATRTGTDGFDDLSRAIDAYGGNKGVTNDLAISNLQRMIDNTEGFDEATRQMLTTLAQSGDFTIQHFGNMVRALDTTSDAFDDSREAINNENKALLDNADTIAYFSGMLGADKFQALKGDALATAEVKGRTDEYTYALEVLTGAVTANTNAENMARFRREEQTASLVKTTGAAGKAILAFQQLAKAIAESSGESEKQAANIYSVAESLGVLDAVLSSNLTLAYAKALEGSDDFRTSLEGLAGNSYAVEMAVREQLNTMLQAIADTKNFKGSVDDLLPVLNLMYNDILAGASDADMSREAILELIDSIGILDSLEPDVRLAITMNAEELQAQIAAIRSAITELTGDAAGRQSPLLKGLREQLATFTKLSDAITRAQSGRTGGSRGGGGGGAKPAANDDPFAWVEGWTEDIAGLANDLISKEFARTLFEGTPEQIVGAFEGMMREVERLGLNKLPQFAGVFESIGSQMNELIGKINEKTKLQTDIEDAKRSLEELGAAYEDVRKEAGKFDPAISGAIAPSETALDKARNAQAEYERLLSESERIAQESASFKEGLARSIAQPLTAQGSAMSQTSKTLKNARAFRDNLMALRDKGFPPDLIAEVAQAGVIDGNRIAKSLLSMGGGDLQKFLEMRREIANIAGQASEVAASVIFGADTVDAEGALSKQYAIVQQLFADAIGEAKTQFEAQQAVVTGLETSLDGVTASMNDLIYAIQVDLYNTFAGFLAGLNGGLGALNPAPTLGSGSTTPSIPSGGGTVSIMPFPNQPPTTALPSGFDAGGEFTEWLKREANKLVPGKSYKDWNLGPLPNGGAIVGPDHTYLPPGLDFSGFMAEGGIATRATLVGVGEAGPEAIIPLSRLDGMGGNTYIQITVEGSVSSERDLVESIRQGLLKSQKNGRQVLI